MALQVPACDGSISVDPSGYLICSGAWLIQPGSVITLQDAYDLGAAILFVLALAYAFRAARQSMGRK